MPAKDFLLGLMTHGIQPSHPPKEVHPSPPRTDQNRPRVKGHPRPKSNPLPKGPPPPKVGGKPDDSLVGMQAHIPYPTGMELGIVCGVYHNKGGVVLVE